MSLIGFLLGQKKICNLSYFLFIKMKLPYLDKVLIFDAK